MTLFKSITFSLLGIALPFITHGAISDALISCGETVDDPCDFADFITLLNNLFNVIIQLALAVTVLVLLIVGARYLFAGSSSQKTLTKKSFTKLAIGFGYILGGWLIVNTLFAIAGVDTAFNFFG